MKKKPKPLKKKAKVVKKAKPVIVPDEGPPLEVERLTHCPSCGVAVIDQIPNMPHVGMDAIAKRDFEWQAALAYVSDQIAFDGNPKRYVDAVLYPLIERANREANLAVRLRQKLEEVAGPEIASSIESSDSITDQRAPSRAIGGSHDNRHRAGTAEDRKPSA